MVVTKLVARSSLFVRFGGTGTLFSLKCVLIFETGHVNMVAFSLPSFSVSVGLTRLPEARLPARPTPGNELPREVGWVLFFLDDFFAGIVILLVVVVVVVERSAKK